jgi:hypothetical protein
MLGFPLFSKPIRIYEQGAKNHARNSGAWIIPPQAHQKLPGMDGKLLAYQLELSRPGVK